ncbi:MAG: class I SAM-dependent methyltransferase [bacterium]
MTDYLDHKFDWGNPEVNWIYDDLPQWSAMCGFVLLRHLPLRQNLRVLDLGCGDGFPTLEIAQRLGNTSRVIGIDPWSDAIRKAKRKSEIMGIPNVEFVEGDAGKLPFEDHSFDLIVSNLLINNLSDRNAVMSECRRVAKPDAILSWGTNLREHMPEFYGVFELTLQQLDMKTALAKLTEHIQKRVTIQGLNQMMVEFGFTPTRSSTEMTSFRFVDGSTMLRHFIIKEAFLDDWRRLLDPNTEKHVFRHVEEELNRLAQENSELNLSVPMAYIEARKG